jgi:hypothetical protein
MSKRSD